MSLITITLVNVLVYGLLICVTPYVYLSELVRLRVLWPKNHWQSDYSPWLSVCFAVFSYWLGWWIQLVSLMKTLQTYSKDDYCSLHLTKRENIALHIQKQKWHKSIKTILKANAKTQENSKNWSGLNLKRKKIFVEFSYDKSMIIWRTWDYIGIYMIPFSSDTNKIRRLASDGF